jgi:hypothetical protein
MNRNDSPRAFNKIFDILKDLVNSKIQLDKFSSEFIEALNHEEENYVFYNNKRI